MAREATDQEHAVKRSEIDIMLSAYEGLQSFCISLQETGEGPLIQGHDVPLRRALCARESGDLAPESNSIDEYKKTISRARGECLDEVCPKNQKPSEGQGSLMGQLNGTANGTANGTTQECDELHSSNFENVQDRTSTSRCTQPKWDNQNAVPLKNPVTEGDPLNGTSFEGSREIAKMKTR